MVKKAFRLTARNLIILCLKHSVMSVMLFVERHNLVIVNESKDKNIAAHIDTSTAYGKLMFTSLLAGIEFMQEYCTLKPKAL